MASLDQLRQLSQHLSPSFKISAHEVADVLSAVVQALEHGDSIIQAVERGGAQGVADFYHDRAVSQAQEAGTPEPEKGVPVAPTAPTGPQATVQQAGTGASAQDVAELIQQVQQLRAALANQNRPTEATAAPAEQHAYEEPASVRELPYDVSHLSDSEVTQLREDLASRSQQSESQQ